MVAILIIAHKNLDQLFRLIKSLSTSNAYFFIHLDIMMECEQSIIDDFTYTNNNVFFVRRLHGKFDNRSLIDIPMLLIEKAREIEIIDDLRFSYYFLLSGQDYPLMSFESIIKCVKDNYPKAYIDCTPYDKDNWIFNLYKHPFHPLLFRDRADTSKKGSLKRKIFRILQLTVSFFSEKVFNSSKHSLHDLLNKKFKLKLYGGSAWWILPDIIINYIYLEYKKYPKYLRYLLYSYTPEESFFQTMCMNSDYSYLIDVNSADMILQNCKTYAFFFDDTHVFFGHPYLIGKEKVQEILSWKKHWFARKFDMNTIDSRNALDYLDTIINKDIEQVI